jgi:hypothetical protein
MSGYSTDLVHLHLPAPDVQHRAHGPPWAIPDPYDRAVSLEWEQTTVDARDPRALGSWWREALGWVVVNDDPEEFEIRPAADRLPGLLFLHVADSKTTKNRLHLDLRPDDRDAEVERLRGLGATQADIGQGEQSWIVLADPEGNEFCVLAPRAP